MARGNVMCLKKLTESLCRWSIDNMRLEKRKASWEPLEDIELVKRELSLWTNGLCELIRHLAYDYTQYMN